MPAATLNEALDIVSRLPDEVQEELYEVLRRGHVERWRKSVAAYGRKALADSRAGKLKSYSADQLIARLRKQWEEPDD